MTETVKMFNLTDIEVDHSKKGMTILIDSASLLI